MTMRKRLQVYLPIEKLHLVLEMVPPPLGVKTRNTSQATLDMRVARIIMNMHSNIHSTPLADTSVEVSTYSPLLFIIRAELEAMSFCPSLTCTHTHTHYTRLQSQYCPPTQTPSRLKRWSL